MKMKAGTTGLLTRAATARIVCPAQASRQQRFKDDVYKAPPARTFGTVPPNPLRHSKSVGSEPSPFHGSQKRVSCLRLFAFVHRPLLIYARHFTRPRTSIRQRILTKFLVLRKARVLRRLRRHIMDLLRNSIPTRTKTHQPRTSSQKHNLHMSCFKIPRRRQHGISSAPQRLIKAAVLDQDLELEGILLAEATHFLAEADFREEGSAVDSVVQTLTLRICSRILRVAVVDVAPAGEETLFRRSRFWSETKSTFKRT